MCGGKPKKRAKTVPQSRGVPSKLPQWTKDACCLASSSATKVPEPREWMVLAANSLGFKRLCFSQNGDAEHIAGVTRLAYSRFGGPLDLLWPKRKSSKLFVIQEPSEGLTVL